MNFSIVGWNEEVSFILKEKVYTNDFVFLAVPDRSAKQTLYGVAGVVWVLILWMHKKDNDLLKEKEKEILSYKDSKKHREMKRN